jgi:selenium-binding protein 1
MATTDPTFYRSPGAAVAAAPEKLAYVAAFDPAGRQKDALAVVDCDPGSPTYAGVVGWAELPTAGNELHHFGWNACSSALCHDGHGGHGAGDHGNRSSAATWSYQAFARPTPSSSTPSPTPACRC